MTQELYELPEGWEWKKLNELTDKIGSGSTPRGGEKAYKESGIPLFRSLNVHDLSFREKNLAYIDDEQAEKLKNAIVAKGDVLLNITGASIARSCLAPDRFVPARVNQHVTIVRPKEGVSASFLNYLLVSPKFKDMLLWQGAGGATRQALTKGMIEDLDIPLPDINEQQRLVKKLDALLSRIDTAIEHLKHSLELNDQLFASSLNQTFNPQGAEIQSDGTYQLPKEWEWKMLNDIAEVARGKSKHRPRNDKTLFNGDYPFIQTGDVRNAVKYIESYSETYNEKGLAQSKLWPAGTICLTIAANIGDVAILKFDACFPDSVVGITPNDMNVDFIYHFLSTIQQQLDSKANSAAQKNINLKILSEIEVPVPSRHKQEEIVKRIDELQLKTQANKQALQQKLEQLQQLKASLLDSAFRGEL